MPLYEYKCSDCRQHFEVLQKFSDEPVALCIHCGGQVTRLISPPTIQFKGTGWYVTDYARKTGVGSETKGDGKGDERGEKSAASSEAKPGKKSSSTPTEKPTID